MDTSIMHNPILPNEKQYLPYVGNGYIGLSIFEESTIAIKSQVLHFTVL